MRPKVKLILDERNGKAEVVDVRDGETLPDGFTFRPVPLMKLCTGYGRPWADVLRDAELVARVLNADVA